MIGVSGTLNNSLNSLLSSFASQNYSSGRNIKLIYEYESIDIEGFLEGFSPVLGATEQRKLKLRKCKEIAQQIAVCLSLAFKLSREIIYTKIFALLIHFRKVTAYQKKLDYTFENPDARNNRIFMRKKNRIFESFCDNSI